MVTRIRIRHLSTGLRTGARPGRELAGHEDSDHADQAGRGDDASWPILVGTTTVASIRTTAANPKT